LKPKGKNYVRPPIEAVGVANTKKNITKRTDIPPVILYGGLPYILEAMGKKT